MCADRKRVLTLLAVPSEKAKDRPLFISLLILERGTIVHFQLAWWTVQSEHLSFFYWRTYHWMRMCRLQLLTSRPNFSAFNFYLFFFRHFYSFSFFFSSAMVKVADVICILHSDRRVGDFTIPRLHAVCNTKIAENTLLGRIKNGK